MLENKTLSQIDRVAQKDLIDLEYCLLPGKYIGETYRALHTSIFDFWHWQWSETFRELEIPFAKSSEEFCRHEEVTCLLSGGKVVACALIDYFDVANSTHRRHHYFNNYPDEIIAKIVLRSDNKPVFTFGYLALHPDFRKNYSLSDIILGLAVMRIQFSASPLMITYTRNTRRTNFLTYRLGGEALAKDYCVRGEPSDFVMFDHSSLSTLVDHPMYSKIRQLWNARIFVSSKNILVNPNKGRKNEKSEFGLGI